MFSSWIIDSDPIISMDLVELLHQHFADAAPRVFETADEALGVCDALPALAILRATHEDQAFHALLDRLNAAATRLILLEAVPSTLGAANIQSVPLPFSSEHIISALDALFDATQRPTLRPVQR